MATALDAFRRGYASLTSREAILYALAEQDTLIQSARPSTGHRAHWPDGHTSAAEQGDGASGW